jgi:hypothetical protein
MSGDVARMSERDPAQEQLFFCFGPPKSGTTLLQRALSLHPQVSCPSEHQFSHLLECYRQLFKHYNQGLELIDRRTGGQGASLIDSECIDEVFRATVEIIMRKAGQGKPITGIKDNDLLPHLHYFDRFFGRPKIIVIFRNPIDQGLSQWHHNLRLAREENNPQHSELLAQFGGLDGWLRRNAQAFVRNVNSWMKFAEGRDNVHIVRYEELIMRRKEILRGIFAFLGADTVDATLDPIVAATDLCRMRNASRYPGFFRAGAIDLGGGEISPALRREVVRVAGHSMIRLGYQFVPEPRSDAGSVDIAATADALPASLDVQ